MFPFLATGESLCDVSLLSYGKPLAAFEIRIGNVELRQRFAIRKHSSILYGESFYEVLIARIWKNGDSYRVLLQVSWRIAPEKMIRLCRWK